MCGLSEKFMEENWHCTFSIPKFYYWFFDSIKRLNGSIESNPENVLEKLMAIIESDFVYGDVLRLVTNFDKMETSDCLRYALTAQLLAIYLDECTDFFKNLPEKCTKIMSTMDWKKFTAAILMRHMGQLVQQFNEIKIEFKKK